MCVEVADEDAKLTGGTAVQNNWGFYQSAQGYPQVNVFLCRGKKGWVVKGHLKLGKQKLKYFRCPNHRKVSVFCFVVVFFIYVYRHRCVSGIRDDVKCICPHLVSCLATSPSQSGQKRAVVARRAKKRRKPTITFGKQAKRNRLVRFIIFTRSVRFPPLLTLTLYMSG